MSRPPNESGGTPKGTAAVNAPSQAKPDETAPAVKAVELARWLDMAIVMHRMGATDPAEFQRLGLWLQRMRRAVG
jgi:hypothetical protein